MIFPMGKCATQIQECICKFDRLFAPDNVAFYCCDDLRAILRKALTLINLRTSCRRPDRLFDRRKGYRQRGFIPVLSMVLNEPHAGSNGREALTV